MGRLPGALQHLQYLLHHPLLATLLCLVKKNKTPPRTEPNKKTCQLKTSAAVLSKQGLLTGVYCVQPCRRDTQSTCCATSPRFRRPLVVLPFARCGASTETPCVNSSLTGCCELIGSLRAALPPPNFPRLLASDGSRSAPNRLIFPAPLIRPSCHTCHGSLVSGEFKDSLREHLERLCEGKRDTQVDCNWTVKSSQGGLSVEV